MSDNPNFSRRDFLKLAGAGALGLAFRKPIEEVDKANITVEQERSFETNGAIYTPFFERHTNRNSDQRIIDVKPDYLFIEYMDNTDRLLSYSPLSIINAEAWIPGIQTYAERFLSETLSLGLDEIGSSIVVEGITLPLKLETQADIFKMTTDAGSGYATCISLGVAIERLIRTKELSKGDYTRIFASTLAYLWSGSDDLSYSGLRNKFDTTEDTIEVRDAQNIAIRLHGAITFAHPEDVIIFMRNIFMSLKLITLSEQKVENENEKVKIAFRIGVAHGAVSDMVKLGKNITTRFLDIYSNDILKQVIDDNISEDKPFEEKIDDFCKIIVIPVHEARLTNTGTKYLTDEKLKDYLNKRFIRS